MVYYPKKEYELLGFEKSHLPSKKYNGILQNKLTKRIVKVPFGASTYSQYFDKLGLYSSLNHLDEKRRTNYLNRHKGDINLAYSPSFFSREYLW